MSRVHMFFWFYEGCELIYINEMRNKQLEKFYGKYVYKKYDLKCIFKRVRPKR